MALWWLFVLNGGYMALWFVISVYHHFIADDIDDYYNFIIPPQNIMFGKSFYFYFNGVNLL